MFRPSLPCLFLSLFAAAPALAQQAPEDRGAVAQAGDAFGLRVGGEQIGLYSESQVRGFNLQDTGNFQIEGLYFARSAHMVDVVLAGVVTRVGPRALDVDLVAPSGVVDYRLRSPFEAPALRAEVMRREYGGWSLDLAGSVHTSDGRWAGLVGGQLLRGVSASGQTPDYDRFGAVVEWRPRGGARVLGFGSANLFDLDGFYGVSPTASALPPAMKHPGRYAPSWSDHDGRDLVGGVVTSVDLGAGLEASGALVYSHLDLDGADFTLLEVDETGRGRARTISNRPRDNSTLSAVGRLSWRHAPGHRLFGELRVRRTAQMSAPSVTVDLGPFDLRDGVSEVARPDVPAAPRTRDVIDQTALGVGYELSGVRWRLKAGSQAALHARRIERPGQPPEVAREAHWLYDLSAAYALGPRTTVFATAAQGMEESGVAPGNASNASEVLPGVLARQQEVGVQTRLNDRLTLIGSLFSIEKPGGGFNEAGAWGLIGELRHRGLELSLTGQMTDELRLVTGAAWLQARRDGPQVAAGEWSREAVGLPEIQAMVGATYAPSLVPGLTLDVQATHASDRRLRATGDLRTPAGTTVDAGFRYAFGQGERNWVLRGRIGNLTDEDGWFATRSEMIERPARRGARLSLTSYF